jgi:hypothetical protein
MDDPDTPPHLESWFVDMRDFIGRVFDAYPFAVRVLPGFHPWNTRTGKPNYLPRYLSEQIDLARHMVRGYWIYNEGNRSAGDPRDVLDRDFCRGYGVSPEDYVSVLRDTAGPGGTAAH